MFLCFWGVCAQPLHHHQTLFNKGFSFLGSSWLLLCFWHVGVLEILGYGVMDPSCDCQKHFTSIVVLCRFCNKRTSSSNVSYSLNKASCSYSLQQLLLSHAWARSKLSQMGCLLESMPQRHGRLSGGNWIFGSRYCSWITPWPSTYPVWTIKDLFRMFELARKRLQDIFGFPCIFSQDQQTHKKLP